MIHTEKQRLAEILKHNRFSLTKGRLLVFDLLHNQPPLSMAELNELIDGRMDPASLYRIIKLFEGLGIVKRVQLGWKYKLELSELFSHHHHHLTCLQCGQVIVLDHDDILEKRLVHIGQANGFAALVHHLELQGVCPRCQSAAQKFN